MGSFARKTSRHLGLTVGILVVVFSAAAAAQDVPAAPPAPPASSASPNIPGAPVEPGKIPYASLSPDERKILYDGPISDGQYVAGGVVGTFLGFGIGQAIEGRYGDTGWIFTVGELGSTVLLVAGAVNCLSSVQGNTCTNGGGEVVLGYLGILGFRIWEIVDVWAVPPGINRRYRDLRQRVADPPHASLGIIPLASVGVGVSPGLGLTYRF